MWRREHLQARHSRRRHRRPRPIVVNEEAIPTLYLADVVRLMRDGFGIDYAMVRAGIDADDALTAWRTA